MDDQEDIEALSRHCMRGFDELLESLASYPEELHRDMSIRTIENDFARFKIWCGNLGALQRGRSSLDVRLRGSIVMRDTVMKFLGQLQESLKQSIEITTGSRTPWEELKQCSEDAPNDRNTDESSDLGNGDTDDEGSDTSDEGDSELAEKQSEIQDTITHLYRLSFKMRNASYRSLSTRALSMKSVDPETGVDLFSVYAEYDYQFVLESLQQLRQVPQPLTPDLRPVRKMTNNIPIFLLERLSRAMTNRRRCFAYWQKHALKLSHITDGPLVPQRDPATSKESKPEGLVAKFGEHAHEQNKLKDKLVGVSGPETVISGTDISNYRSNLDDHLETDTVISHATTAKDVDGKSADLPPPPVDASSKREFVCPYCKVACPSWQGKGKSWRTHVLQDLQPYVCTYPDCPDGDRLYASRGAWMEHERICHRRVWRCFEQQHRNVLYKSKEQLHLHLSESHVDLVEPQIQSLLELTETTTADGRGLCPFCDSAGPFDKGLHNHMAFHQESLAAFAAPRHVNKDDNDDASSGKVHSTRSTASLHSISLQFSEVSDAGVEVPIGEVGDELYVASENGNGELVKLLLEQDANVNAQSGQYANALQAASYNGHKQVVKLLLDAGADVNAQSGQYANALQTASYNGHKQVVKLLLDAGADVNAQGGQYGNALQAASAQGHEQVVKLLLDKGADINAQGGRYGSALQAASAEGHEQVVKLLQENRNRHEDLSLSNRAWMYRSQGLWREAEELEVQVIQARERTLGQKHPETLTSVSNLGLVLSNQGKYEGAEAMHRRALEGREEVLGPEHPDTLTSVSNLGLVLSRQGKYEEAESMFRKALEEYNKVLGEEHLLTMNSMATLALLYNKQGRWTEAEELFVQVLEKQKRVLGVEHPSTLDSLDNLASVYQSQGQWKEVQELDVQAIETKKRVLGVEHPSTLNSMASLALTYNKQGRWTEAEKLLVEVMEKKKRVFGVEHPSTLITMDSLALVYESQGRWNEAEELFVQVMEARKRVLGEEHPDTLSSMTNLAHTWKSQSRNKEAISMTEKCFELQERILGPHHPATQASLQDLIQWRTEVKG